MVEELRCRRLKILEGLAPWCFSLYLWCPCTSGWRGKMLSWKPCCCRLSHTSLPVLSKFHCHMLKCPKQYWGKLQLPLAVLLPTGSLAILLPSDFTDLCFIGCLFYTEVVSRLYCPNVKTVVRLTGERMENWAKKFRYLLKRPPGNSLIFVNLQYPVS